MSEVKRYYAGELPANEYVIKAFDFDRVTAERNALQERLNAADQNDDDLQFQLKDREGSRRDWFEEAQRLQAELDKRDALLRECAAEFSTAEASAFEVEMRRKIEAALSASAEPGEREVHALQAEKALGIERLPAKPSAPVAVVPQGYCVMPRHLTAENGAKALLLGEFTLQSTHECPECRELEEPSEGCEICDGEGEYGQKHTIPWDQIKFIYSKAVEGLAVKAEPAKF